MSLENEYFSMKQALKNDKTKLAEAKAIEIVEDENTDFTIEERIKAKNRAINSIEERITETEEILEEIRDELKDFIANGGEVSEIILKELEDDESSDSNEDWIYFKLQHKENKEVELIGCIDLATIDDDEPETEWVQNDGTWETHLPNYCTVDNCDCTFELESLKETLVYESSFINQYLVDCSSDSIDELSKHEFNNSILYVSYDYDKIMEA